MTEPIKEQVEPKDTPPDLVRRTAEGKDQATPFLALTGVTLTIAVVAGALIAVLLLVWWLIAR
jgi:hypothetical protein